MPTEAAARPRATCELSDEEVVRRVVEGDPALFEVLMRRHNARVYRVARSVLLDDIRAEDLAQEVWVRVYERLHQFAGEARFSTWLAKIALHEAWARARKARRLQPITEEMVEASDVFLSAAADPESVTLGTEMRRFLESAVEALPEPYRIVLVLRDVEELSTAETADALQLTENAVKIRLHRARAMMRRDLSDRVGGGIRSAFPFLGERCDRIVGAVMARIGGFAQPVA
ncbi:MAG TPA: RNA polymerase sigma factor [Thermoanaerobaculia bacterium]|jgi:RNA polymerase sigma-70 factor (ECF subfamily)